MPELPEVETCRRIIVEELIGDPIVSVELRLPKLLRFSAFPSLESLVGRWIVGARRRGKVLIVDLDDERSMVIHLKLSGQISVHRADGVRRTAGHPVPKPDGSYPHAATHLTIGFGSSATLHLSDVRQFGWLRLLPTPEVEALIASFDLAPEANNLSELDVAALRDVLRRRRIPTKAALLDQRIIAGIGNIYVDEALHRARVHPATPANQIDAAQLSDIVAAVRWALDEGIKQGGAKIVHQRAFPIDGFPEVHAREGEACPVCGDRIVKLRVGGRGTYICPSCQPSPRV